MTQGIPPRRSGRNSNRAFSQSSSEYHESEMDEDDHPPVSAESPESPPPATFVKSQRGRRVKLTTYRESSDDELSKIFQDNDNIEHVDSHVDAMDGDDEDDDQPRRQKRSSSKRSSINDDIASNRRVLRNRNKNPPPPPTTSSGRVTRQPKRYEPNNNPPKRLTRAQSKAAAEMDDGYVDEPSEGSVDADGSLDDAPRTSSDNDLDAEGEVDLDGEGEHDLQEVEPDGRPYSLRQRARINYAIPPALEDMKQAKPRPPAGRSGANRRRGPGWSASGAELSRWMGMAPADDSDSDFPTRTPRKPFGGAGVFGAGGPVSAGGAGLLPGDLAAAAAGTPSNLGKIGDAALADADPLGVNTNVTFDEVGGLDDHIHSLKEMTLLPLLYPEVFQRFNLTPPRGVLFHGPPGTGKTLLARALAASCRSNGKGVSFFMRKGADCLSKWVGEAERQLRLLFEEARNCQPSIIFFDEIDGLAPVRSSKQDQIHASIVSTLLALMDGMDGRGQVIVIGATNRPDAIDPALRRPGRFDREFYFPLPSLEARERILTIMTKDWEGWKDGEGAENIKGLAKFTKGYGGADLRALCTEAALNAIQRRYPQIYQSSDRLLLKPETIGITFRDFMISIKKLVPSSARSSSSAASPLPNQLVPLLSDTLGKVKDAINRVLPVGKKRTALEEAMWEDDSEENALERELFMQSMETLRVYRPRLVLHGPVGMGQGYLGAAALHHLEGYHVQTLDLGTLISDSTRTAEAAVVQLFVEAKRHQPSVIYIPSLDGWSAAISEIARSTVRSMLDSLAPTDPVLVLAIVDGPFSSLPRDVRSWFGMTRENRLLLPSPTDAQREAFFSSIIADIRRPPNQFADGMKRRKRVLEELPIAPPLEPRQPTAAEIAAQEDNDQRVITLLKYRLGPILTELKRKFKRFTKKAREEYNFDPIPAVNEVEIIATTTVTVQAENEVIDVCEQVTQEQQQPNGIVNGIHPDPQPVEHPEPPQPQEPQLFDMDLERMHVDLYKGKYLTPQDFLDDINKIVFNTMARAHEDTGADRLYKAQAMLTAAEVSIQDFDPQFKLECQRMAERQRKRREEHKKAKGKGKAGEDAQNGAAAPRRSARHNGQQLEITITDPLQLERRLKRARSDERHSGSPESGDDKGEPSTPRNSKRQRTASDDDHDPMDIIGASRAQNRGSAVRFANDVQPPPDSDALPIYGAPTVDGPSTSNAMAVDSPVPRKSAGFDPMLLNPISPDNGFPATSISHMSNGAGPSTVPGQDGYTTPIPLLSPAIGVMPLNPSIPPPRTPSPLAIQPLTPVAEVIEEPMVVVPPAEIERTPTPLPDFHVDEHLLSTLQYDLCSKTAQLSVELLEQLRATVLGCIWRHRTDWDRDELIREVKDALKEFLDDFAAGGDDPDSP
ncbi:AAA-domain-containing protein [Suillus paluster]|uniref:AAA-domain-containing protein n=1 Tax=Suillus paluster TaxID=48578 RepID=UPI001B862D14|nr:AAA-domain-containing protein [Suillus paluster]KAG1740223.1 AAA-domain-containing protein [Suillus paluster]